MTHCTPTPMLSTQDKSRPVALIDIGSNSVRLVVYRDYSHYPFPILNERVTCKIGEGLDQNAVIQQKRAEAALQVIARFGRLLDAIQPAQTFVVATAAVRRAQNGERFAQDVEAVLGYPVDVLPASEEARLISLGLTRYYPALNGLVADLGGGSIELVQLVDGEIRHAVSLNIGHLTTQSKKEIKAQIKDLHWLSELKGQALYGIGGSFRALGAGYIARRSYPLKLLHGLEIPADECQMILSTLTSAHMDLTGIPSGRQATIAAAATIMSAVLKHAQVSKLVVSGTSIRDGLMADISGESQPQADPLLLACGDIARQSQRHKGLNEELARLLTPVARLFKGTNLASVGGEEDQLQRMVEAACLLSDICWNEASDLRGQLAADRILALPVFSLSHIQRAWLAKAVLHRYVGVKKNKSVFSMVGDLLSPRERISSKAVGLGMRFAIMFSGGMPVYLSQLKFAVKKDKLICKMPKEISHLMDEQSRFRLSVFAESCRLKAEVVLS